MSRAALKAAKAAVADESTFACVWISREHLRAVVAMAERVADLRKRIRLARREFYAAKLLARAGTTDVDALARFEAALDLRRPLKTGGRK